MERSEELQKQYVEKHGEVGKIESKSKTQKKRRYKLHKIVKAETKVFARRKEILFIEPKSLEVKEAISELINEFGYFMQSSIG